MRHRSLLNTTARCAAVAALVTTPALVAVPAASADGTTQQAPAQQKKPAGVAPTADFNNDGHADLATAAPEGTVDGTKNAGYVAVVYGSAQGADTDHHKVVSPEGVDENERFGTELVTRDLDGDGYTDLVAAGMNGTSKLYVYWGGKDGLSKKPTTIDNSQAGGDVKNLTAGDFDGDGTVDLAVAGTSTEGLDGPFLHELRGPFKRDGSPTAVRKAADFGEVEPDDMVAGDLTGDGKDDLVSFHSFQGTAETTQYFTGSEKGLKKGSKSVPTLPYGYNATVGDVNGDGYGDLVVRRVKGESVEGQPTEAGAVEVIYGSKKGPTRKREVIDQDTAGVPGVGEEGELDDDAPSGGGGDQFGYDLSAGDVNGDGYADIAVGVPYEDNKAGRDVGSVVLLKGASKGLSGAGAQAFTQDSKGVPGIDEADDNFGAAVSLLDTDGDGKDDLAVGAPGEDAQQDDSGAAWVLRGTSKGVTSKGAVSFGPENIDAPTTQAALGSVFPS